MADGHQTPSHQDRIRDQLLTIPPRVTVSLLRKSETDSRCVSGTLCPYDRRVPVRTVETGDDTLVLTATPDEPVTVSRVTATGPVSLGKVHMVSATEQPTRTLRVTNVGVEVPPDLCGCAGLFWIDRSVERADNTTEWVEIPEPGLDPYDSRLLTDIVDTEIITIESPTGPALPYCVHDERTRSDEDSTEPDPTYRTLETALTELNIVATAVETDAQLDQSHRQRICRTLADVQTALYRARQVILETLPAHDRWAYDSGLTTDWTHYGESVSKLQIRCSGIARAVSVDDELTDHQVRRARSYLGDASHQLERLASWLRPAREIDSGATATRNEVGTRTAGETDE